MSEGDMPQDNVSTTETTEGGQRQVRLRVDERNMSTDYANGFRTNATAEEVIIDFGLNLATPARPQADGSQDPNIAGEMVFQVGDRVIMNYYTAKRLAMTLSNLVRRHEERFGELKLNANERTQG